MHGQLQHPAARLAGRPPRSSVVPLEPFKNKVFKPRRQGPGKRRLPGRPTEASQGTCRDAPRVPARPNERQASGCDKTTTAARHLQRQAATLCPRSSASTNVSPWRPFQARVAEGCAASGARWHATLTRSPSWRTVAPLTVLFCTVRATQTGI